MESLLQENAMGDSPKAWNRIPQINAEIQLVAWNNNQWSKCPLTYSDKNKTKQKPQLQMGRNLQRRSARK